jgi:hypothetical protein
MKKISIGTAVAGGLLCALALAGCQGSGGAASGAAVTAVTSSAASGGNGSPGDGVPSATPTGTAAVDAELNTVDQELGTASTDLAQATASPSDGG